MDILLSVLALMAPLFFYVLIVLPLRLQTKIWIGVAALLVFLMLPTLVFLLSSN